MYLYMFHLFICTFTVLIHTDTSTQVISIEISHVETFEVEDEGPQDFIKSPYKEIELELNSDDDILRYEPHKKGNNSGASSPTVGAKNSDVQTRKGTNEGKGNTDKHLQRQEKKTEEFRKNNVIKYSKDNINKHDTESSLIGKEVPTKAARHHNGPLPTISKPTTLFDKFGIKEKAHQFVSSTVSVPETQINSNLLEQTTSKTFQTTHKPLITSGNRVQRKDVQGNSINNSEDTIASRSSKREIKNRSSFVRSQLPVPSNTYKSVRYKVRNLLAKKSLIDVKDNMEMSENVKAVQSKLHRKKRQVGGIDMNILANEGWDKQYTTQRSIKKGENKDSFQVISDKDRQQAEKENVKNVLIYLGTTLLSVLLFTLIAYCFIKNPKGCIMSFGTGCPCCVLCLPCYNKCWERINPTEKLKENLNKYLPGVIIHEDGTLESYKPSPEEIEIVCDIIDEVIG